MVKVYTCTIKFLTPSGERYEEVYATNPDKYRKMYGINNVDVTGFFETSKENWKRLRYECKSVSFSTWNTKKFKRS